ncbi:MAG: carbonate dehydratase [Variovorax sp.]
MSDPLDNLFAHNRAWANQVERDRPGFFTSLVAQQSPKYMWIGCSDSRVPANQITGLEPGEVFVHRNVANVVVPTDLNCLSAVQFAVDQLKVEHVMVCGHYGCGGVRAVLDNMRVGLADNWLHHVKNVRDKHKALIDGMPPAARHAALCELNVIEQVMNVAETTVMLDAWKRGQGVILHGWIYGIEDGLLKDLHMTVGPDDDLAATYHTALRSVASAPRDPGLAEAA